MLHKLHKASAVLIGLFIFVHLINHLYILVGIEQHIEVMNTFRLVYRNILAESILLLCIFFQICSGIYLVWKRKGQRSGFLEKAQAVSGLYLAFFFINHVGSVFFGRLAVEVDTNIYFGIAGFYTNPFQFYFIPYYSLSVIALFVHLASAFNWLSRNSIPKGLRESLSYLTIVIGIVFSGTLVLGFNGVFYEISIPQEYSAMYE